MSDKLQRIREIQLEAKSLSLENKELRDKVTVNTVKLEALNEEARQLVRTFLEEEGIYPHLGGSWGV